MKLEQCSTISKRAAAAVVISAVCGIANAAPPPASYSVDGTGRYILSLESAAASRFAVIDADNDGLDDLVFSGFASNDAILVVGKRADGTIGFKQAIIQDSQNAIQRILATKEGGQDVVLAVYIDGTVREYAGWPLALQTQFSSHAGVISAAVGDTTGNGGNDLIVLTADGLYAYSLADQSSHWHYLVADVTDIALAQLDNDPALEIILSNGDVIDGATRAVDWRSSDPFGPQIITGHFLADASTQFASATSQTAFTVYSSNPWQPLWSATASPAGFFALGSGDIDGQGHDVILEGDSQWGSIHVFDPNTHQQRFSIANPGWGTQALAVANVAGDSKLDIVFAAIQDSTALMQIVDSKSGAIDWSFAPLTAPFRAMALGDVDGDGAQELVVGSAPPYYTGSVDIFDASTGALKWNSPFVSSQNDPLALTPTRLLLIPHTNDGAMDIVVAGTSTYDGRITVIDGATHATKLQIGSYAYNPMAGRYLNDAALLDYDRDGTPDFVVATGLSYGNDTGPLLQVFSGVDGHVLWTAEPMHSGFYALSNVIVTGPASDPSSEILAVVPGTVHAYNIQTQALDWTLLATSDGVTYVPNGVAGAEIATFLHSGAATFYDLQTQDYLRSFALPSPLNALRPLEDGSEHLLAVFDGRVAVIDGITGTVLAVSDFVGSDLALGNNVAVNEVGANEWDVVAGNYFGVFTYRLRPLGDPIFADGFESVP